MRLPRFAPSAAAVLLSLPLLASANAFGCDDIVTNGENYNLKPLGGAHTVSWMWEEETRNNFTFGIDICGNLKMPKDIPKEHRCKDGTRVCGINQEKVPDKTDPIINRVVHIAGNYMSSAGRPLDPKWTRLQDSGSHADQGRKGLRLELHGGKHPFDKRKGQKQQAVVEFVCDEERSGLEDEGPDEERWLRAAENDNDNDGDDDDDDSNDGLMSQDCEKSNRSLSFCSYQVEDNKVETLRLMWRTKYACADMSHEADGNDGSSHWGFFTWLIVIIFLGVAGYLIFGSWLNYSRYGARGWDLVPHGETIRDIPYLIKDFGRNLTNAVTSGGSRGGYSAV